jgi:DNA modification methylase
MITLIHGSFEDEILKIPSGSVDIMVFDPPYKYLENQRLETEFDEALLVSESKRILKKNGMIAFFGRDLSCRAGLYQFRNELHRF